MPYLINSLVVLIITIFLTSFSATLSADDNIFILPEKKPIQQSFNYKKQNNEKKIINNQAVFDSSIPRKKPIKIKKKVESNKIEKKKFINQEKKIINKKKIVKKVIKINNNNFLLPIKKPIKFKIHSTKQAKKSKILNSKDFSKAKEVMALVKKKQWKTALNQSKKIKDKEFQNLIKWIYLKQPNNLATFNDYENFISKNPDYPRISRLRYLAEHKIILQNTNPNFIINWFSDQEPLSGTGKIKLGEAYFLEGNRELGSKLIKSGWTTADLSSGDLKFYRKKFKKIFSSEDHIKRADYLAWNNKYWDLKRMLRYLPKDKRLLYNARFVLMTHSYGVDKAIADVPQNLKEDIGLKFDRLKWRNRRNRLESSLELLSDKKLDGTELVRPDLWWKQRKNITRDLIYKKNYPLAYKVASNHSLYEGPDFADAEWLSGWLSLSFLNNPDQAIKHFKNFYNNVGYPISLARGAYWLGRSYEKINEKENAKKYYKEGSIFTNTYYGQLSFNKIYVGENFVLKSNFEHSKDYEKEFYKNKLIRHVKLLKELDNTKYSKDIINHLAILNVEKGSEVLAAKLATEVDRYDYSIQISKRASYEKRFINLFNYPIITTPKTLRSKTMPVSELILAIIRQESEFDAKANSYVGAKGMMQLMPSTAKLVARQLKVNYSKGALISDPEYNINLGTYYFHGLLNNYDGVFPFAIAAYNAGPNRVKTWKKNMETQVRMR